jgi:hypothetical protein
MERRHLLEQLSVLEARLGGLVGGAVEQVVAGDAEGVGEALEGVGGGSGLAALVAADQIGVQSDELGELGVTTLQAVDALDRVLEVTFDLGAAPAAAASTPSDRRATSSR